MAPSETFQAAKDRLAVAEKWATSASQMLKSSEALAKSAEAQAKSAKAQEEKARNDVLLSQRQVKEAKEYLKNMEEKLQVIDVDSEEDVCNNAKGATVSGSAMASNQTQIVVNCLDGGKLTLDIEPSDTSQNIRTKIVNKVGATPDPGWPTRFIATDVSGRKRITFDVQLQDTPFGSIKAKLDDRICALSDAGTIHRFSDEQQVICHCTMMIFIKGVRAYSVYVEPSDTIKTVKDLVSSKTGISAIVLRLMFAAKNLEDCCILADYEIKPMSTLKLV